MTDPLRADGEAGGPRAKETIVDETRSPGGARAASNSCKAPPRRRWRLPARTQHESPAARAGSTRSDERSEPEGIATGRAEAGSPDRQAGRARNRTISEQRNVTAVSPSARTPGRDSNVDVVDAGGTLAGVR